MLEKQQTALTNVLILAVVSMLPDARAASDAAQDVTLEEIVVTATKRETRAQDTPVPLSVFSESMLERSNTQAVSQLGTQSPSLVFSNDNSDWKVTIRGVGSDNVTLTSKQGVALHQDGVYLARPAGFNASTYDVQRIEVLRGPQGTLYGRNATGGAINVISNPPTHDFGARADVLAGDYDRLRARGAVNVPLVKDKLALRVTASKEDRDGYQKNLAPGGTQGDDADELYLRGQLLWDLSDRARIIARIDDFQARGVGPVRNRLASPTDGLPAFSDPRVAYKDQPERNRLDQTIYSVEGNFDLSWAKATIIAGYSNFDVSMLQDGDASPVVVPAPGGETSFFGFTQSADQFNTEIRLSSASSGPFRWLVGAFYMKEEADERFHANNVETGPPFPPFFGTTSLVVADLTTVNNTSIAAFSELSYDLREDVTVTIGGRYTKDEADGSFIEDQRQVQFFCGPTFICDDHLEQFPDGSWNKTTWKLGLDWRVASDHLLYATASTGFRSGGFNVGQPDPAKQFFEPEDLLALELGSKNLFADGRIQFNVSAFHYDYDNQQVQQIINFAEFTENSASEVYGIETELVFKPARQLEIDAHLSYLKGTHESFLSEDAARPDGPDGIPFNGDLFDVSGNDMIQMPEFSGHLGASCTLPLGAGGVLILRAQVYAQTRTYLRHFNLEPFDVQEPYTKTDVSLKYDSGNHWYIHGGVDNLEDEDVIAGIEVPPNGRFQANLRAPRTWYVGAGVEF